MRWLDGSDNALYSLESACDQLHLYTPSGWYVGRPGYDPGRHQWTMYAFDPSERPRVGLRSRAWIAVADSELDVVIEMARCLFNFRAGRVPR